MQRPSFKWGRAAKLAAGAALVLAIREQDRGDHTHHIAVSYSFSPSLLFFRLHRQAFLSILLHAWSRRITADSLASPCQYLLSEPVVDLKRTQLRLLPHLALDLPRNCATSHLPSLAGHLCALASASVTTIPKGTLAFIRPLLSHVAVQGVLRTASALYDLPNLEKSAFNAGSAGAGGCALLLLALEAHACPPRPMPRVLVLASLLGAALGAGGAAVMARYRVLVNAIEAGTARLPWLANANNPRSKHIPRRARVASAVLDVLHFREEIGQAEIAECGGPIHVDLEAEDDGGDGEGDIRRNEAELDALLVEVEQKTTENTRIMSHGPGSCVMARTTTAPERKSEKRRTATIQATSFLLDPLANLAPAFAHTSYLLSSDAGIRLDAPPTRLQLLAAERGNTDAVRDDELFGEGELEGIVIGTDEKSRDEREKRAQAMWMIWGEGIPNSMGDDPGTESVWKRECHGRPASYTMKKGRERVDLDKLAALLDSDDPFVAPSFEEFCSGDEDNEGGEGGRGGCIGGGGGEDVEGEWRPTSPGGFEVEWHGEW
jgi:transcription factor IIIB subunit 2